MRGLCQQFVEDISTCRIKQVAKYGAETLLGGTASSEKKLDILRRERV
jgi:hypothetical protein